MNLRLQNQLNIIVGACITVAQSSDYKPVWKAKTLPTSAVT